MQKILLAIFVCITFIQNINAQLADFSLLVVPTNETCTGNGTLTFSVSGTTSGSSISYAIYELPNTVTPIAVLTGNTFGGLTSGAYTVVATQSLGAESNTQQQTVTIINTITELVYSVAGNITCNDGVITVTVTQGNPTAYEIISGPVIRPLQPSNVFSMLPAGVYTIRVFDACGDAVVQTFTLENPASDKLVIGDLMFPDCPLLACNTINTTASFISTVSNVHYPVTVVYTIYPPSGSPIVQTIVVSSGVSTFFIIETGIPFYNNQAYSYDIQATDDCGNIFSSLGNPILKKLEAAITIDPDICFKNIEINACNFVAPITINFISAPAGFNPSLFNAGHPGPFGTVPVKYISTASNVMPDGVYTVSITDACGRTAQGQITLEPLEPGYLVLSQPCDSGTVLIPDSVGTPVVSVIMTAAPAGYPQTMPYDVSFNINDGQFAMGGLPAGVYSFTVVDVCGETYDYTLTILPSGAPLVVLNSIKGCGVGEGSIRIEVVNAILTSVLITTAPPTFPYPLPYDISSNLDNSGILYMNDLPEGTYIFFLQDQCSERSALFQITGYQELINDIVVDANCGSFNIDVQYQSNESSFHDFWLQRQNAVTGQWEHPLTGVAYLNGSVPNTGNSYRLLNNQNNLNIVSIGTFRVLRTHEIFSDGSDVMETCIQPIKNFIFTGGPRIIDAYALPCTGGLDNIVIIAEGLPPLQYSITLKNSLPFVVTNGTSNVFTSLGAGLYNFQVEDICGNIVNRLLDLGTVPPPTITQSGICPGQPGTLSATNFPFLNYQWWSATNPGVILSTTSTLTFPSFGAADSGTYFVSIYSDQGTLCTDQILSYTIPPNGTLPNAGTGSEIFICSNTSAVNLFSLLSAPYDSGGAWTEITASNALIGSNWLPAGASYGAYQFLYTVNGLCETTDTSAVMINYNAVPPSPTVSSTVAPCAPGNLQLFADNPGSLFQYQWIGPNGFASNLQNPVIVDADATANGIYSVTATSGGCVSATASVPIIIDEAPEFILTGGCSGNQFLITAAPASEAPENTIVSYIWTGPQNFSSNSNPINITNGSAGTYSVTVTAANGCSSLFEIVIENTMCAVPVGISPNSDGQNDSFDLTGLDVLNLEIFNRHGRLVYEQDNYVNQWHGQDYNNRILPDATYYYYIRLGSGEERTGWVYVTK